MRAGRPVPSGPLARAREWLRFKLSSELQHREWAVDEQLGHLAGLRRPNTSAPDTNPDFGTLAALAADELRSTRSLADLLAVKELSVTVASNFV